MVVTLTMIVSKCQVNVAECVVGVDSKMNSQ